MLPFRMILLIQFIACHKKLLLMDGFASAKFFWSTDLFWNTIWDKNGKKLSCYRLRRVLRIEPIISFLLFVGIAYLSKPFLERQSQLKSKWLLHGLKRRCLKLSLDSHFKIFSMSTNSAISINVCLTIVYIWKTKSALQTSLESFIWIRWPLVMLQVKD